MSRQEYVEQVLSCLRHMTDREKGAIRRELEDHMEDHACALLELGYDPELADRRTMAAMGEPAEVGRELNRQYPLRWLVIGGAAKGAAIWLAMALVFFTIVDDSCGLPQAWRLRMQPAQEECGTLPDTCLQLGKDVVRLRQVTMVRDGEGRLMARVKGACYDRSPFGIVAGPDLLLENQRGEKAGAVAVSRGVWCGSYDAFIPVQPGDTYVTVSCGRYGQTESCRIPLPEGST